MATTKRYDIWVCPESSDNKSLFMSPDEFQRWVEHVETEIVSGGYAITAFSQDAHWRMKNMFVYNERRFKCLDNPYWNIMCMYYPIPTDTKRCEFTKNFFFSIGKSYRSYSHDWSIV